LMDQLHISCDKVKLGLDESNGRPTVLVF